MGESLLLDARRGCISGPEMVEIFGVSDTTVWRWARRLGYPPIGSGARRYFTRTDVLICRAWQAITDTSSHDYTRNQAESALCDQAAAAIRRRTARWLIVTPRCGFTHPSAEEATRLALQLDLRRWWLIDLLSRRG